MQLVSSQRLLICENHYNHYKIYYSLENWDKVRLFSFLDLSYHKRVNEYKKNFMKQPFFELIKSVHILFPAFPQFKTNLQPCNVFISLTNLTNLSYSSLICELILCFYNSHINFFEYFLQIDTQETVFNFFHKWL